MAVGDIIIHQDQITAAYEAASSTYSFRSCFEYVSRLFAEADLVIGNLETTFSGNERGYTGYPRFNAPEVLASELKQVGFDVITTANNHSADCNEPGIVSTLEYLDAAGLLHTGTARSEQERNRPLIVECNQIAIAITAYTYGTNDIPVAKEYMLNLIDYEKIAADVARARQAGADTIITMLHFGPEYLFYPDTKQIETVKRMHSIGVDIVLGSHSHIVQSGVLSADRRRYAIFSMGNFISNQRGEERDIGVIVELILEKDSCGRVTIDVCYHPTYVHKWTEQDRMKYLIYLLKDDSGRIDGLKLQYLVGKYSRTMARLYGLDPETFSIKEQNIADTCIL